MCTYLYGYDFFTLFQYIYTYLYGDNILEYMFT